MKTEWQSGKGMNVGCGGAVIKHIPHPFVFEGFWETIPAICAPPNSPMRLLGNRNLGFHATATHVAHLSLPLVITRRIIADFSAIY